MGAVQIWPEWKDQVEPMQPMAAFTSASSKTTQAPLPPSSSSSRFMVRAAFSAMVTPTWVEPVKLTQSTSSESTSAAEEAGPLPLTRLTTPGGKPTSSRIRTSSTTASGSWGAGFTTTVLPGGQRRGHLAGHVDHGEVVRRDAGHHADRLAVDHAADDPARGQRRGLGRLGQQRRLQHLARVAGVALEAVGRDRHLHARADRGGGAGLGDDQGQQLGRLGPDGRGRLAHEGAAVLGRPGRPARLGLLGRRGGGQGVVGAGVGGLPDHLFGGKTDSATASIASIASTHHHNSAFSSRLFAPGRRTWARTSGLFPYFSTDSASPPERV